MSLKPKPEGSIWSDDQWKAIAETGDDILVAAAAWFRQNRRARGTDHP